MARQAKIYFQDQLAGFLVEGDNGYSFYYDKAYLNSTNSNAISLTLPISEHPYHSKVLFPFFDGLIPEFLLGKLIHKTDGHNRKSKQYLFTDKEIYYL